MSEISKRIIVSGASGYLGSRLVHEMLRQNFLITAIINKTSDFSNFAQYQKNLKIVERKNLKSAFEEKVDGILHTATLYGRRGESNSEILDCNLAFPLELLQEATKHNVAFFINTDTSIDKATNAYSLSKKQFVEWAEFLARDEKISFINVILEHFFGPDNNNTNFISSIISSLRSGKEKIDLTEGKQKRDFIYIDDAISAFMIILKNCFAQKNFLSSQNFNIASGKPISIRQAVETIHRLSNSSVELCFSALPYRKFEKMESEVDISALEKLGWKPKISFEEGIKKILEAEKE